jgi:hypothetical protein
MKHEVDKLGYPVDEEMRNLEFSLSDLAAMFRAAREDSQRQAEIVSEYSKILSDLYKLGWDGSLDAEAELPSNLMPQEYKI